MWPLHLTHDRHPKAAPDDCEIIAGIGRISVGEAHWDSCSAEDMQKFLDNTYSEAAVREELDDAANLYHLLSADARPAGFSKLLLNAAHPNIPQHNAAKLDRIYLLNEFSGRGLGYELLKFNIGLAKELGQAGLWLFTWVGNTRAVDFYLKAGFSIVGAHRFKITETHYNENHQMLLRF